MNLPQNEKPPRKPHRAHKRRATPLTPLDAYLMAEELTNAAFAERVRAARGHPCGPTHVTVSCWRRGRAAPSHDLRAIIEVATHGAVSFDAWETPA
jgi:hypothetical protein